MKSQSESSPRPAGQLSAATGFNSQLSLSQCRKLESFKLAVAGVAQSRVTAAVTSDRTRIIRTQAPSRRWQTRSLGLRVGLGCSEAAGATDSDARARLGAARARRCHRRGTQAAANGSGLVTVMRRPGAVRRTTRTRSLLTRIRVVASGSDGHRTRRVGVPGHCRASGG
jgi:hypothetical protein